MLLLIDTRCTRKQALFGEPFLVVGINLHTEATPGVVQASTMRGSLKKPSDSVFGSADSVDHYMSDVQNLLSSEVLAVAHIIPIENMI